MVQETFLFVLSEKRCYLSLGEEFSHMTGM